LLNKINLITPAKIRQVHGEYKIKAVVITINGETETLETDAFIPLFG